MNGISERPIKISISSAPSHLPIVRAAVEKACLQVGFDHEISGSIVLSVDEALTNIIRHAYKGADDKPIEIELSCCTAGDRDCLRICICDYGLSAEPETIKSRDLADVRPGGLGVHIINECMDCVEFAPGPSGGTILTMTKHLPVKQEATQ